MVDIKLDNNNDIEISASGDVLLTESIVQSVKTRLRWIKDEWRLGPNLGFPYFEEAFVKNPNIGKIRGYIREEILKIEQVNEVNITDVKFDKDNRKFKVKFYVIVDKEKYYEEVEVIE